MNSALFGWRRGMAIIVGPLLGWLCAYGAVVSFPDFPKLFLLALYAAILVFPLLFVSWYSKTFAQHVASVLAAVALLVAVNFAHSYWYHDPNSSDFNAKSDPLLVLALLVSVNLVVVGGVSSPVYFIRKYLARRHPGNQVELPSLASRP